MKLAITAIAILLLVCLFISTASAERSVTVVRGQVSGGSDGFSAVGRSRDRAAKVRSVASAKPERARAVTRSRER